MRAKQFVPIVEAQQELFEVNMSPGSLKKLAGDIDALVGIEFEMMVPDIGSIEDEDESPGDESAEDIDDICRFFEGDGEWNERSTIRDLRDELNEKFYEFQDEEINNQWSNDDRGYFTDWVRNNVSDDTVAAYLEKEEDEDLDGADWIKFIEENYEEGFGNEYYDSAYEDYRIGKQDYGDFSERDFLRSISIYNMSDVAPVLRTQVYWPGNDNDNASVLEALANDFSDVIGREVYSSTGYHDGPRENDAYTIEPDSSLDDKDYKKNDEDAGLEFISPPLPIDEALADVKKIKKWADEKGAYTTEKTGLHMNVSVPGFDPENLDYVKLALLLGDKYLLERFGRSANTYCRSALEIIEDAPTVQDKEVLFKKLKDNLETMASKVIVQNYGSSEVKFGPVSQRIGKFTSINPKNNRVEFRGPGGDWLGENFDKIEETLYRTVVALDAAVDPEKYRKEYLKKLTKMLDPAKGSLEDVFVQYAAGTISREALKNRLRGIQSQRKQDKLSKEGVVELEFYDARDGDYIIEYDNPNGDNRRMFLKRTEQVSDPNQAVEAAMKLEPSMFKPDDIENIIATEYTGRKEYNVFDKEGNVVGNYTAWTPLHAIDITLSYNDNLSKDGLTVKLASEAQPEQPEQPLRMAPGESEFVVINSSLDQRVSLAATNSAMALSRALRNNPSWDSYRHQIRILSATPQAEEPAQEPLTPAQAQQGAGQMYQVSDPGTSGGVTIRATSPEHAIERAREAWRIDPTRELEARLFNG